MVLRYHCPDCHAEHAEPLSAAYVLAVRCADCELTADVAALSPFRVELQLAA